MHKATFFNFEQWGSEGKAYLQSSKRLKAAGVAVAFADGPLHAAQLPADRDFDILGVFADSTVDAATIAALPRLKFIATLSTGFDHIDIAAASARGVPVASVPAYGESTVAEFAFALLLALSRKITESRARVRDEHRFTTDGLSGFDLAGKTLGVIGTGRIGKHAVRMGKGFGMNIVAYDAYPDTAFAAEMGYPYLSLEELLKRSDIITIHCPNLPSTYHLINRNNIGLMKPTAHLINTARGTVVETAAVAEALKAGKLGGAGLDVLEEEAGMKAGDMAPAQELLAMPNVILTPHNAFNTREAYFRILDTTADNIAAFVNGTLMNVVAPPSL